jgi:hypothetical protein
MVGCPRSEGTGLCTSVSVDENARLLPSSSNNQLRFQYPDEGHAFREDPIVEADLEQTVWGLKPVTGLSAVAGAGDVVEHVDVANAAVAVPELGSALSDRETAGHNVMPAVGPRSWPKPGSSTPDPASANVPDTLSAQAR